MKADLKVALTGTPGTGKTAIADELEKTSGGDLVVIHINDILEGMPDVVLGKDEERGSLEVDVSALDLLIRAKRFGEDRVLIIEGHLSHLLEVDHAIVLRCHPRVLKERLESRGYPKVKVAENVEAEAIDVITIESVERLGKDRVSELVTTDLTPVQAAAVVLDVIRGGFSDHKIGSVDWSSYLMTEWYPDVGGHGVSGPEKAGKKGTRVGDKRGGGKRGKRGSGIEYKSRPRRTAR